MRTFLFQEGTFFVMHISEFYHCKVLKYVKLLYSVHKSLFAQKDFLEAASAQLNHGDLAIVSTISLNDENMLRIRVVKNNSNLEICHFIYRST